MSLKWRFWLFDCEHQKNDKPGFPESSSADSTDKGSLISSHNDWTFTSQEIFEEEEQMRLSSSSRLPKVVLSSSNWKNLAINLDLQRRTRTFPALSDNHDRDYHCMEDDNSYVSNHATAELQMTILR